MGRMKGNNFRFSLSSFPLTAAASQCPLGDLVFSNPAHPTIPTNEAEIFVTMQSVKLHRPCISRGETHSACDALFVSFALVL